MRFQEGKDDTDTSFNENNVSSSKRGHSRSNYAVSRSSTFSINESEEDIVLKTEELFDSSQRVDRDILEKDEELTSATAQDETLVLGTNQGRLLVLNTLTNEYTQHKTAEKQAINQIAITGNGFAALSRFGTVTFVPLSGTPVNLARQSRAGPPKAFKAFRQDFGLSIEEGHITSIEFVQQRINKDELVLFLGTAQGRVLRYSKTLYNTEKIERFRGEQPILQISILHGILRLSTHSSVYLKDINVGQKFSLIEFNELPESVEKNSFSRLDGLRPPCAVWRFQKPEQTGEFETIQGYCFIAKFNIVRIVQLRQVSNKKLGDEIRKEKTFRVLYSIKLDYLIAGVAPLKTTSKLLLLLAYLENQLLSEGIYRAKPYLVAIPSDGEATLVHSQLLEASPVPIEEKPHLIGMSNQYGELLDCDNSFLIKALRKRVILDEKENQINDFIYIMHPRRLLRLTQLSKDVRIRQLLLQGNVKQATYLLRKGSNNVSFQIQIDVKRQEILMLLDRRHFRQAAMRCYDFSKDIESMKRREVFRREKLVRQES